MLMSILTGVVELLNSSRKHLLGFACKDFSNLGSHTIEFLQALGKFLFIHATFEHQVQRTFVFANQPLHTHMQSMRRDVLVARVAALVQDPDQFMVRSLNDCPGRVELLFDE